MTTDETKTDTTTGTDPDAAATTTPGGATTKVRVEHDSMGEIEVPAEALWGAQTARAVQNFPISGIGVPSPVIHALATIKAAAATVNVELGVLDADLGEAIASAASSVARGEHDEHFPVDVFQTGSGTSTNMNVNEVVARLARLSSGLEVHPNDHVNAGQSSNDTFPTALRVAATVVAQTELVPALMELSQSFAAKATEFADVVKAGRTHLMDAVPVTLGQEFGGYARQLDLGVQRVLVALHATSELPLGGTAAGTGLNAAPGFAQKVIALLSERSGITFREAEDHFEAQSAQDALVELSGALRTVAVSLTKICNDLRWMASGPRAGLREIRLPDLQPGSSIMPGKVNPVVCEATLMVSAQVIGNDVTVTTAGAAGSFELNVMLPVIARNVLESIQLLARSSRVLAIRCVDGIEADAERCRELAEGSPSIVTPLNRYIGYEAAAKVVKQALAEQRPIRDVVVDRGHVADGDLTEEELDEALDLLAMARGRR